MGYEDENVTELRKFAIDRGVAWKDDDGKPKRRAALVEALEKHDATVAQDAAEGSQAEPTPEEPESPQEPPAEEAPHASAEGVDASEVPAQDDDGETDVPADDEPEISLEPATELAPLEPYLTHGPAEESWVRVTKDVRFRDRGVTHKIAKGSVLSNRHYDLEKLLPQLEAQGMPIEECGAPVRATDAYGKPRGRVFGAPLPVTREQRTFDQEVNPQLYVDRDDDGQPVRLEADGTRTAIPKETAATITTPDGRIAVGRTDPHTGKPSPGAVTNG